ncbi:uncharacterized protein MELLADRAFT_110890 [Melampsora larici-populina 98AG31]|uniref:Secreted protein n=1 Tax=Melampsora larici-populina (strain 98AG31 / pathotype 3-4-7) TaxID=747676 RepID=F4S1C2_MELLP|nr:uncharacterized protein MELLADRAFT_110890 [Melampsora larici-populina 98AG31]EGG01586.1 hypothetical protein MELLADRAFT_110890 [Melampsora larici-populina 98AG31]
MYRFNRKSCQSMALMLHWPILLTAMGGRDVSHLESLSLAEPLDPALSQPSVNTLFDKLSLGSSTTSTMNIPASSTEHMPPIANMPGGYDEDSKPILRPISETKQGSGRSSESFQDSPSSTFDSLIQEPLHAQHASYLSKFERLSIHPDEYSDIHSAPLSKHHGASLEKSTSGLLDSEARPISKNEQNDMPTSQNTKLPFQAAWVTAPRSGRERLKRPSPTSQVDLRPSKRPTHHDPSLFDGDDESVRQVKNKSPQKKFDLDLMDHKSFLPYASIDAYQPRINRIMSSISERNKFTKKFPISRLQNLWDDYIIMIAMCSKLVSSDGKHTNIDSDLRDAINWMLENWSTIPQKGSRRPDFVYHDTARWLSLRQYSRARESLAAKFIVRFVGDERHAWIEPLNRLTDGSWETTLVRSLERARDDSEIDRAVGARWRARPADRR